MAPHGMATLNRESKLIVAHADSRYRADITRRLRLRGMDVFTTSSASAVHALAHEYRPGLILLDTELKDESGPLTCAKLKISYPDCKVMLVGKQLSGEAIRLARFVGADEYVSQSEGLDTLIRRVCKQAVPTAC